MSFMKNKIDLFLKKLREMPDFDKVNFVFLFGSHAQGKENKFSDIDFAVYCDGDKKERFKFRMNLLGKMPDNFDIQIFQDLPLYVRKEVLKGKVIYARDKGFVYEIAYETIKAFEDFKKGYYDYINELYEEIFLKPFSKTAIECEGKSLYDIWPREIAQQFIDNNNKVMQTGQIFNDIEGVSGPLGLVVDWRIIKFKRNFPLGVVGIAIPKNGFFDKYMHKIQT